MLLGIALSHEVYKPGELTGLYTLISLGAVIQTIWLAATSLGMGFQFVSTPQEIPEKWALTSALLGVPDGFELMVLCRLGYEDPAIKRPTIDWSSPQRKGIDELAFQEAWGQPVDVEPRREVMSPRGGSIWRLRCRTERAVIKASDGPRAAAFGKRRPADASRVRASL